MNKFFAIVVVVAMTATSAFAWTMPRDKKGEPTQTFSPNGNLSQLLTVNSTTVDISTRQGFSIYAPSAGCKFRLMPASNSTKANYKQRTAAATQYVYRAGNRATPFVNFSGCTDAELDIQD